MAGKKNKKLRKGESLRKDGRYMYRWTDANGNKQYIYAHDLDTLREQEKDIMLEKEYGIKRSDMTVEMLYQRWTKMKINVRENTKKQYMDSYEAFVKDAFGKRKLSGIKKSDVKSLAADMVYHGYSASTVKRVMTVMRQMFQMAVDDDLMTKNPASEVLAGILPKQTKKQKEALTVEEQQALLDYAPLDKRQDIHLIILILLQTGMRVGEFCALTWDDVDFEKRMISIDKTMRPRVGKTESKKTAPKKKASKTTNNTGKGAGNNAPKAKKQQEDPKVIKSCEALTIAPPKTFSSRRKIPMTKETVQSFLALKKLVESYEKPSPTVDGITNFCYNNKKGMANNPGLLTENIAQFQLRCNRYYRERDGKNAIQIKHSTAHIFRHTFATRMFDAGVAAKSVQSILGHNSIAITLDVYTDSSPDQDRWAMEKMNDYTGISKRLTHFVDSDETSGKSDILQ